MEEAGKMAVEERTVAVVTLEIKTIQRQALQMAISSAIQIGMRLVEAKGMVPHGEWGSYVKELGYSQSTAQNLIRIFEEYGDDQLSLLGDPKSQTFGNLSYSKAVALLALPGEEREEFLEENDVEGMSTRELRAAIKERDEAKKKADDMERLAEAAQNRAAGYEEKLKQAQEQAQEQAESAQAELAALREELEALRSAPVETAVEKVADQDALDAAAAEAKEKAEAAKVKAEQDLAALKVAQEEAAAVADQEKKVLADQVQDLQKKLVMASSGETTIFKLYFDQTQANINKMVECVGRMEEAGDTDGAGKLKAAFCAMLDAAKEVIQ